MMTEGCPKLASKAPPGLPKAEPGFNPPFNSAGFVVPSNTDHLAAAVEFAICQRLLTGIPHVDSFWISFYQSMLATQAQTGQPLQLPAIPPGMIGPNGLPMLQPGLMSLPQPAGVGNPSFMGPPFQMGLAMGSAPFSMLPPSALQQQQQQQQQQAKNSQASPPLHSASAQHMFFPTASGTAAGPSAASGHPGLPQGFGVPMPGMGALHSASAPFSMPSGVPPMNNAGARGPALPPALQELVAQTAASISATTASPGFKSGVASLPSIPDAFRSAMSADELPGRSLPSTTATAGRSASAAPDAVYASSSIAMSDTSGPSDEQNLPSPLAGGSSYGADDHACERVCYNCKTTSTPLWRRSDQGHFMCNACGLYMRTHGKARPPRQPRQLSETTQLKRMEQQKAMAGAQCGNPNCGVTKTTLWRRDPQGRVLCNSCGLFLKLHGCDRPDAMRRKSGPRQRRKPWNDRPATQRRTSTST